MSEQRRPRRRWPHPFRLSAPWRKWRKVATVLGWLFGPVVGFGRETYRKD